MYLRDLPSAPLVWTGDDDARIARLLELPHADVAEDTFRELGTSLAPPLDGYHHGPRLLDQAVILACMAAEVSFLPVQPATVSDPVLARHGLVYLWGRVRRLIVRMVLAFLLAPRDAIAEGVYRVRVAWVAARRRRRRLDVEARLSPPIDPRHDPGVRPCMVSAAETLDGYLGTAGLSRAESGRGGAVRPVGLPM